MANQMLQVFINIIFPKTHLEKYLAECSVLEFERRLTVRQDQNNRMFSPYYYKDPLVKDCLLELKNRNNEHVARLLGHKVAQWIAHTTAHIRLQDRCIPILLVPIPQHISRSKEKGFLHTRTLCEHILKLLPHDTPVLIKECICKTTATRQLHNLKGKRIRFKTIKGTMRAHITKDEACRAHVILIDDIRTTGATFNEAYRCLVKCGVDRDHIYFVSIAH
jgi:predicted amidophosphoribosyltransferase